jgi:acyl-CoA synthetase (AMP-forming)/AMP-acid ligase II
MAETTFAVTQSSVGETARTLEVDWEVFAREHRVARPGQTTTTRRTLVSSGRPIAGTQVRVVDDRRVGVPDGKVGEIAIASSSLMSGYFNSPERTAEVLADGWYFSGDLGFIDDGHVFVTGRRKDMIIIAGNNVYPQDVEEVVSELDGVYPGRVVSCGVWDETSGTEQLVILAETLLEGDRDRSRLKLKIASAVRQRLDCTANDILLVPHMWLVKSSSGKISRSANRDRYLEERRARTTAMSEA